MKPYLIVLGPRGNPRLSFPCMATDACAAAMQHMGLALPAERMEVIAL